MSADASGLKVHHGSKPDKEVRDGGYYAHKRSRGEVVASALSQLRADMKKFSQPQKPKTK